MFIGEIKVRGCVWVIWGCRNCKRELKKAPKQNWQSACASAHPSVFNADCANTAEEFRCSNVHVDIFRYRVGIGPSQRILQLYFFFHYNFFFYPGLSLLHWLPIVILFQENCGEQNFLHIYSIHTQKYFYFLKDLSAQTLKPKTFLYFIQKKNLNQNQKPTKQSKCLGKFGSNVLAQLLHTDWLKVYYFTGFLFNILVSFQLSYYWLVAI